MNWLAMHQKEAATDGTALQRCMQACEHQAQPCGIEELLSPAGKPRREEGGGGRGRGGGRGLVSPDQRFIISVHVVNHAPNLGMGC